jgi:hypothetical protein
MENKCNCGLYDPQKTLSNGDSRINLSGLSTVNDEWYYYHTKTAFLQLNKLCYNCKEVQNDTSLLKLRVYIRMHLSAGYEVVCQECWDNYFIKCTFTIQKRHKHGLEEYVNICHKKKA